MGIKKDARKQSRKERKIQREKKAKKIIEQSADLTWNLTYKIAKSAKRGQGCTIIKGEEASYLRRKEESRKTSPSGSSFGR